MPSVTKTGRARRGFAAMGKRLKTKLQRQGGQAVVAKFGPDYMRTLGARGGTQRAINAGQQVSSR